MEPMVKMALRAAQRAAEVITQSLSNFERLRVEEKSANDFVTEVDRAVERELIRNLRKAYPEHAFLGEESGWTGPAEADHVWVIDPIDGTTNFIHGIPHYAISMACRIKGKLQHAVVYDVMREEAFTASRGCGAELNGRRIRVSLRKGLEGALIGTGIPFKGRNAVHLSIYLETLKAVAEQTAGIRRAGAASLDLAYVAAGRLDGFWEIGLSEWDIAAGVLLVQEAGGLVSDFKGGHDYLDSGHVVCGSPKVFKGLLQAVGPSAKYLA